MSTRGSGGRNLAVVVSAAVASYNDFEPNRIKHMEMIQAVIARAAGNSFLIKGWALTLTGAFLGFGVNKSSPGLAAAAFLPILVFWLLDTYYLRMERLFRELYTCVRIYTDVEPFFMAATSEAFLKGCVRRGKVLAQDRFSEDALVVLCVADRGDPASRDHHLDRQITHSWHASRIRSATPSRSTSGSLRFGGQMSSKPSSWYLGKRWRCR